MLKYPQVKGKNLVLRDESGRIVKNHNGAQVATLEIPPNRKRTWRAAIRASVGNDGEELWALWLKLARGQPVRPKFGDLETADLLIPSFEVQRAAIRDLAEFAFGKPVAQTEVVKAEEQAEEMNQLEALSDAQLLERMRKTINSTAKLVAVHDLAQDNDDE